MGETDWGFRFPSPIAACGVAAIDKAIASIGDEELPALPEGHASELIALFRSAIADLGEVEPTIERKKVAPKKRKDFDAAHRAALQARAVRDAIVVWLCDALGQSDEGRTVLVETALDGSRDRGVRFQAARVAAETAPSHLASRTADPSRWEVDETNTKLHSRFARAIFRADAKDAFDRLSPWVRDGSARAEAILSAGPRSDVNYETMLGASELAPGEPAIDPRWIPILLDIVKAETHDAFALFILAAVPIDGSVIDTILERLGDPEKVTFDKAALRVLERVADPRCIPYLLQSLRDSWMAFPYVFRGLATAGDAVMAHAIREWLAANKGPAERARIAKECIAILEAKGKAPKPAQPFFSSSKPKRKSRRK